MPCWWAVFPAVARKPLPRNAYACRGNLPGKLCLPRKLFGGGDQCAIFGVIRLRESPNMKRG